MNLTMDRSRWFWGFLLLVFSGAGCANYPRPGSWVPRKGDENCRGRPIFHTGTPVVLWMDPGGI
jgi:hypothetical protein